jgi:hypothetical protein
VLDVAQQRWFLGTEGQAAPALVLEREHLLAHDVGRLPTALEQGGVLNSG